MVHLRSGLRWIVALWIGSTLATSIKREVRAQASPPDTIAVPPGIPEILEQITPNSPQSSPSLPESPNLPSFTPQLPITPSSQPQGGNALSNRRLPVHAVNIVGFTILQDEIEQAIIGSGYFDSISNLPCESVVDDTRTANITNVQYYCGIVNQQGISFEDLLELRSAITEVYIGGCNSEDRPCYLTSGAFLRNNQIIDEGGNQIVQIQAVEGGLENIEVCMLPHSSKRDYASSRLSEYPENCGAARLNANYVRDRVSRWT